MKAGQSPSDFSQLSLKPGMGALKLSALVDSGQSCCSPLSVLLYLEDAAEAELQELRLKVPRAAPSNPLMSVGLAGGAGPISMPTVC